jgi:hypothetical protein
MRIHLADESQIVGIVDGPAQRSQIFRLPDMPNPKAIRA